MTLKKQFEPMKFFKLELYEKFNSPNGDEVEKARKDWQSALKTYKQRISELSQIMTPRIKQLAISQFHDADVLSFRCEESDHIRWGGIPHRFVRFCAFMLRTDDSVVSVWYLVPHLDPVVPANLAISPSQSRFWLYDEVDELPPSGQNRDIDSFTEGESAQFQHSILLSGGIEITIPFSDVFIQSVPVSRVCEDDALINLPLHGDG
jgi:hypothetical protein